MSILHTCQKKTNPIGRIITRPMCALTYYSLYSYLWLLNWTVNPHMATKVVQLLYIEIVPHYVDTSQQLLLFWAFSPRDGIENDWFEHTYCRNHEPLSMGCLSLVVQCIVCSCPVSNISHFHFDLYKLRSGSIWLWFVPKTYESPAAWDEYIFSKCTLSESVDCGLIVSHLQISCNFLPLT